MITEARDALDRRITHWIVPDPNGYQAHVERKPVAGRSGWHMVCHCPEGKRRQADMDLPECEHQLQVVAQESGYQRDPRPGGRIDPSMFVD